MYYAILYISLLTLHDCDVKLPNFTFCERREHKNSTPEKLAKICQIERDRIRTTKFETTRIHILNDVFATVADGGCLSSWMKETWESGELIVLSPTLVLANLTYQAIVTSRTCRRGVHISISCCNREKISKWTKGERGLWDWLRLRRPFILFENTQAWQLRIFFIISYVFLLDLTVRTIEPPVRKETWKELINSFNRRKALNCPYIKRRYKINDKRKRRN